MKFAHGPLLRERKPIGALQLLCGRGSLLQLAAAGVAVDVLPNASTWIERHALRARSNAEDVKQVVLLSCLVAATHCCKNK